MTPARLEYPVDLLDLRSCETWETSVAVPRPPIGEETLQGPFVGTFVLVQARLEFSHAPRVGEEAERGWRLVAEVQRRRAYDAVGVVVPTSLCQ